MKKYACFFLITVLSMNLFAKGIKDNTQWINHTISGEVEHTDSIKRIHITSFYTMLTVKTAPDITGIRYKVRGILDAFITVRNTGDEFRIVETDMFPHKKRRTKRTVDAEMEVLIPQELKLEKIEIKTAVEDAVIESLISDTFTFFGSVGNASVRDIQCADAELITSVGNTVFEKITCTDLSVEGGVGNTTVKKITCANAELTGGVGNLHIDELTCDDLNIQGSVGKVTVKDTRAEKKSAIVGGVGTLIFSNCTLTNANMEGGIARCSFKGLLKGECFIKPSIGKCTFTINAPASSYKIGFDNGKVQVPSGISVNGFHFEDIFYGNQDAENILHLHAGLGNIKIRFADPE